MEYMITFQSTNQAIKAEQILLEHRIQVGVRPLMAGIRAGCGIALCVEQEALRPSMKLLRTYSMEDIHIYYKQAGDWLEYKEEG